MYTKKYLEMAYGILETGDGRYYIPEHKINTNDLGEAEEYSSLKNIKDIDKLDVKENDTLCITLKDFSKDKYYYILSIENLRNQKIATVEANYFSDDSRCYALYEIAELFKDIKFVTLKNYLIYDEEDMKAHVNALENL